MSENTINLIINSVVALAGVGLGSLLGHLSNKKSSQEALDLVARQEFIKAAAEFQTAFTEAVLALKRPYRNVESDRTLTIVRNATVQHKNAMLKFRPYLSESKQARFDATWEEYEGEDKYGGGTQEAIPRQRKLALERIEKLLEFAK